MTIEMPSAISATDAKGSHSTLPLLPDFLDDDWFYAGQTSSLYLLPKRRPASLGALTCIDLRIAVAEWLARPTAVWEDRGSNHTADGCVCRDSCCHSNCTRSHPTSVSGCQFFTGQCVKREWGNNGRRERGGAEKRHLHPSHLRSPRTFQSRLRLWMTADVAVTRLDFNSWCTLH